MVILFWILKSSLLLGFALVFTRWRALSAAQAHGVLFIALLCVPVLLLVDFSRVSPLIDVPVSFIELDFTQPEAVVDESRVEAVLADQDPPLNWLLLLGLVYSGVVAAHGAALFARVRRESSRVASYPIVEADQFRIRKSDANESPYAWGLFSPCIVVPMGWDGWSGEQQRSALLHEQAHLRRGDALMSVLGALLCALFWFHPLVWVVQRQALALAEQACDDEVIKKGVGAVSYAEHLLEISKSLSSNFAPAMAGSSALKPRIRALLDANYRRNLMSKRISGLAICGCAMVAMGLMSIGIRAEVEPVSENLTNQLVAARVNIDEEKFAKAHQLLNELDEDTTLSSHEQAQIMNSRAYAYYAGGDYEGAISEYTKIVERDTELPKGLIQKTLYALAQLHFVEDNYPQALGYGERWAAEVESVPPVAKVFMAQTHLKMSDPETALADMNEALAIAKLTNSKANPSWLKFRDYLQKVVAGEDVEAPYHTGAVSGDYVAVAKFAPIYPAAARAQKIEGFVVVEFSVASDGSTTDGRVVESTPAGIFDSAALAAVEKFRYKPRTVDGSPVTVPGIRNTIKFELPDA